MGSAVELPLQAIVTALGRRTDTCFAVLTPGGVRHVSGPDPPEFTLVFRTERALAETFLRGHMGLLEAYFDQEIDLEGSLACAMAAGMEADFHQHGAALATMENNLLEWRSSNRDPAQAKANARAHYGLGEPFYRKWLDEPLKMYTCAYWKDGTTTIEQAQRDKIDHVCRKLRLAAGEEYVDIGCGFGGFMFRAWETTGARGTGVNTTTEQVDWLRQEIARRGLEARLQVREADFRDVDRQYDKVVSIGVLEHAGRDQLADVVRAHAGFLKPGGLGLLHFIAHVDRRDTTLFIRKHVFPGGWIPSLSDALVEMERCGLEVLDVENLRRHYAPTLDAWAERFAARWHEIRSLDPSRFDERFRRIWMCYLVGCAEMFRSRTQQTNLFQVLFSKGNVSRTSYPMTREHLYGP